MISYEIFELCNPKKRFITDNPNSYSIIADLWRVEVERYFQPTRYRKRPEYIPTLEEVSGIEKR
ncbi:MAG: hypothetical protein ACUVQ8_01430 [Nitrososphaeria archaeon]